MDLTLSGADQVRFTTCLETLLSPLSYPDVDGWRRAVNRRMKELFDLEQAMFILSPAKGRALIHSEDYSAGVLAAYTVFFDTDTGNRRVESAGLTVTNLETVVAGDWEGWRRDRFVNAFWRPNGVVDHVGLRLVEGEDRLAQLELHRDRVDPDRCGDRALALMRLLLPAFKAGVGAIFRLSEYRDTLSRVLDSLPEPLMVCDERGKALHQNDALVKLLARDPYRSRVEDEMGRVARQMAALRDPRTRGWRRGEPGAVIRHVRTRVGAYRISGTFLPAENPGAGPSCILALDGPRREPATRLHPTRVAERFGLTRQQTRVALLLAARRSNREVALELGISPHTARRHTEQVLEKLGVHSRRAVESTLKRQAPSAGETEGATLADRYGRTAT